MPPFPFFLPDRQTPLPGGIPIPQAVVDRFLERLRRLPADRSLVPCWRIDGRTDALGTYVSFRFNSPERGLVAIRAHRLSHLYFHGPIPDALHVLHRCACKGCANPEHLYAGTPADNSADHWNWEAAEAAAGRITPSAAARALASRKAADRRAMRCESMAA